MSEKECNQQDKTLEMICQISNNYQSNLTAQAKLFKEFFSALNENKLEKIKEFISKQTPENRATIIFSVLEKNQIEKKEAEVLYLGIPGSLGRSYSKVEKQVEKLIKILSECNENSTCKDILDKLQEFTEENDKQKICPNATVTTIMYLFFPEYFIPFDSRTQKILEKIGLTCDNEKIKIEGTWECYQKVLETLKKIELFHDKDNLKPSMVIALSFAAWQLDNEVDNILNKYVDGEKKAKNIILTGIPGTGKTYSIMQFLEQNQKNYAYEFVQFHPSYDYEDFIEGLKPIPSENGQIAFKLVNGVFKNLCKRAYGHKEKTYVMVIDEINRANLSRVFGELLYCLEYRNEFVSTKMTSYIQSLDDIAKKEFSVNGDDENIGKFAIPDNVIILGTMNEVDRSIDAFDLALRRRFVWEEVGFNETALRLYTPFFEKKFQANIENIVKKANALNEKLAKEIGENYKIGHTYYFKVIDYFDDNFESALSDLWDYHIKSLTREYCKIKFGENELSKKLEEYKKIIVEDNK